MKRARASRLLKPPCNVLPRELNPCWVWHGRKPDGRQGSARRALPAAFLGSLERMQTPTTVRETTFSVISLALSHAAN